MPFPEGTRAQLAPVFKAGARWAKRHPGGDRIARGPEGTVIAAIDTRRGARRRVERERLAAAVHQHEEAVLKPGHCGRKNSVDERLHGPTLRDLGDLCQLEAKIKIRVNT